MILLQAPVLVVIWTAHRRRLWNRNWPRCANVSSKPYPPTTATTVEAVLIFWTIPWPLRILLSPPHCGNLYNCYTYIRKRRCNQQQQQQQQQHPHRKFLGTSIQHPFTFMTLHWKNSSPWRSRNTWRIIMWRIGMHMTMRCSCNKTLHKLPPRQKTLMSLWRIQVWCALQIRYFVTRSNKYSVTTWSTCYQKLLSNHAPIPNMEIINSVPQCRYLQPFPSRQTARRNTRVRWMWHRPLWPRWVRIIRSSPILLHRVPDSYCVVSPSRTCNITWINTW